MRLIAAHDGKLHTLDSNTPASGPASDNRGFSSTLPQLDAIAPGGAFARAAVHELLTEPNDGHAIFMAMLLAMAQGKNVSPPDSSVAHSLSTGAIVWCDPAGELYPPALAVHGFPLERLFLLHPKSPDPAGKDLIWAVSECLRCKGVGAVIAPLQKLSRIEARRLQLAAEHGGGVGILLRHTGRQSSQHAAATRWLVRPSPGSRTIQRWTIQLLHGHGGHVGQTLCLEHCRETNCLRTFDPMADRPIESQPAVVA
jgi:protein ImuA